MSGAFPWRLPIIAAPMAGGPSTLALVEAVGRAGGLGFVPGGYLPPAAFDELLDHADALGVPYGANLFHPTRQTGDPGAIAAYARQLQPLADEFGATLGDPIWSDDDYAQKVEVVARHRPAAVSITFGNPTAADVDAIRSGSGALVAVTVTSAEEATAAAAVGADLLVVQGAEAGGHRGIHDDDPAHPFGAPLTPVAVLLAEITAVTSVPLIAAGGIMDGAAIASAIRLGAAAAQLGTAFLCTDEAGTSAPHRAALLDRRYPGTVVTRAFSGRPARGLANEFAADHADAPPGYPEIHYLTKPLRGAAMAAGSAAVPSLWAGTNWRAVTTGPAAELVARLAAELDREL
ncbi:NAD(P)H-dependent flavin oxidoreductase [Jongsikchunia kroppenstedtii]|uniref:NAD(P)H-dependent flavin oxidoreductase n=1 Tax=Jongsikchunia kroppenstedtii TaxID=1121721 RepID=UPI0003A16E1C|nr:nitronate monooxygenase [Jongsikchunia kroppenstedtii]